MNMNWKWFASAALALGVSTVATSSAQARDRYYDDYRYRGGYYDHRPDYRHDYGRADYDIPISQVPHRALRAMEHERRGRPIESVQYVNRYGNVFYRFRIDGPRGEDYNIRVTPDGNILGIEHAGYDSDHYGRGPWRR